MAEIEDLEKLKNQKLEEIIELNRKISQISFEKMVEELKLEEGKYYEIQSDKLQSVYFKFTKGCDVSLEKRTITIPKAITVNFTRALYSIAYTHNFSYDISFNEICSNPIKEISKEKFEEIIKRSKENFDSLMEETDSEKV